MPEPVTHQAALTKPLCYVPLWYVYAGTLLTAELALQHGLACNTAGGTHHAFPSFGSGFCILNDLAVTAEVLLHRKAVDRILILDLDVHQVI
jgi:acetoin utilization deacetylase AcuC-like enzyme